MKGNKGITLIALVITIIVLLILAGVSIAMLSGDNSILKQAQNARNNSAAGTLDETVKIAVGNIMTANLAWPTKPDTSDSTKTVTDVTITGAEGTKDLATQIHVVNPGLTKADSISKDGDFTITGDSEWTITAQINGQQQTVKVNPLTGAVTK